MAVFTSASNTSALEATLISSMMQEQLLREAKLLPTITDYSSMAVKGVKQIDVPRISSAFGSPSSQNADGETEVTMKTATFAADSIALSDWKNLPYRIPDRVSKQAGLNLEAELAKSAGREMANYIDDQIIVKLKLASSSSPDHIVQMSGASNLVITLADVTKARMLLNKQNVPLSERFFACSPEQEKAMLDLDNFVRADAYGARDGLLEGEIGRVMGFTVIVHNGLSGAEAVAYHKSAIGYAIQQEVEFESQRAHVTLKATDYSFCLGWGVKELDGGKRQVYLNSTGS